MGLLFAIFLGSIFTMGAFIYWRKLGDGEQLSAEEWQAFKRWVWAGQLVPIALWIFFNLGLLGPPVWPEVLPVSAGFKKWYRAFDDFSFISTFLIHSYWAGMTFAWLLFRAGARAEKWRDFFAMCAVWSILLFPLALLLVVSGGWPVLGLAMTLWFLPLLHLALHMKRAERHLPSYSRALAKINFGKYDEAEMEVLRELDNCESDFDGWMMLAELYATHFNDLAGAHRTIHELCADPATPPVQISIALHRLADWHLKIGRDPVSAREALEMICARIPGTHLDRMARQRLNQLPATRKELEEKEAGKPMRLPHEPDAFDTPPARVLAPEQATAEAEAFVEVLRKNPDDTLAREKFARLLAENLGDADTAIDQLQLLLAMPGQRASQRGDWLLTIAAWHARYRNDALTARLVYEEVMRDFPDTPQSFAAQRRLNILNAQAKIRRRFDARAGSPIR